jgi:hypothetical protein
MDQFVQFNGSTGLPDVMSYDIGDEPTFTVHGRVTDIAEAEPYGTILPARRTFTFKVTAADIDQGDGTTLMLPVAAPVPIPAPKVRRVRALAVAALVWPVTGYAFGYVIAMATIHR